MFVYVDNELLELVLPQCVSFLASHLSLCLIQCFHGSIPLLLRPYVKDGKQLRASWISQHPPFFCLSEGSLVWQVWPLSFTHFTVWAETMTKRRQIHRRPQPLIQVFAPNAGHMNKVFSPCTHTHTHTAAQEPAFQLSLVTGSTFLESYVRRFMDFGCVPCKWFTNISDLMVKLV